MSHHIAYQDDEHVFLGERQGVFSSPEESQYRIQERKDCCREQHADDDVQHHEVRKHLVGRLIILLAEKHGQNSGTSDTHKCADRSGKIHQGECDGKSGNGVGSDIRDMADEDAVDHIVQRRCSHGYYGRDCILHQQRTYILFSKF